jgi:hypothetical protein
MYDTWAAYATADRNLLLGQTINGITYPFNWVSMPSNIHSVCEVAMSYAAYRLFYHHYNS